eukprot:527073-Rhodomonas_salina.1
MAAMFYRSSFTGDISKWDVSAVNDMSWMFGSSSFIGNLCSWNLQARTEVDTRSMFFGMSWPAAAYQNPYACPSVAKEDLISLIIGCKDAGWD